MKRIVEPDFILDGSAPSPRVHFSGDYKDNIQYEGRVRPGLVSNGEEVWFRDHVCLVTHLIREPSVVGRPQLDSITLVQLPRKMTVEEKLDEAVRL